MSKHRPPGHLLDLPEIERVRKYQSYGFSIVEIAKIFKCLSGTIDQSLWLWFGVEAAATRYRPDFES